MTSLSLKLTLQRLAHYAQQRRVWQSTDPADPDVGGIYVPSLGMVDPRATGQFVALCAMLAQGGALPDEELLAQANRAADALLRARRPNGLIDLTIVNIDSSPDTAFAVQEMCAALELDRHTEQTLPGWPELRQKIETFVREAVPGILSGGFHTPNHRWVMVSALLQARTLFPDVAVDNPTIEEVVHSYLAETFDIDAEGMFIERSIGVYDAVNNRSLLFIQENHPAPDSLQPGALEAVNRNLNTDLHMLHADGTAETGISRRQDYGTRQVALGLVPYLLWSHRLQTDERFAAAAAALWERYLLRAHEGITDNFVHIYWLSFVLAKYGDLDVTPGLPDDYVHHFPVNGIHRVRRGALNATFFRGATRLLTLTHGEAELSSVKLSHTYFGQYTGRFAADEMHYANDELLLRSQGRSNPRRPAYELPIGKPVAPEQWTAMLEERPLRWLPHAVTTLSVTEAQGGFDLHIQTEQGADNVATQIAFDFPAGGIWETDDNRVMTAAGQVIFLKRGWGAMRYGPDVIRIGPGHLTHGMWQMREAETAPDHTRVLLTFFTPIDFTVHIRTAHGPALPQQV